MWRLRLDLEHYTEQRCLTFTLIVMSYNILLYLKFIEFLKSYTYNVSIFIRCGCAVGIRPFTINDHV